MKCIICGRSTVTFAVLVGAVFFGPKCARRAGLMPLAGKRSGLVRPGPAYRSHATRQEIAQMDLFDGVAA